MNISEDQARLLAWWLRRKLAEFPIEGRMTALLQRLIDALEHGDTIEIVRERKEPG